MGKVRPAHKKHLPRRQKIGKFSKTVTLYIILAASAVIYTATAFKRKEFGDSQINEVLFYLLNGFTGGNATDIAGMIYDNLILFGIVFFIIMLPVVDFYRNRIFIKFNLSFFGKNKNILFNPSKIPWRVKLIYSIAVLFGAVWFMFVSFQVPSYLRSLRESSQIFEQHYVNPKEVKLIFPKKPRNLVYIYLESVENTLASYQAGGQKEQSLIPELERIALDKDTVSFSHSRVGLGGAHPVFGTTWTAGSMASQSLGVPIRPDFAGIGANEYNKVNRFLPGAYGIGEVLKHQGYNQSFVMGSDKNYGGRSKLLSQHGDYHVIDHKFAQKNKLIPDRYKVWWGYEDKKVFAFAKDEVRRLAGKDGPFNLSLLTADTHFVDGYLDPSCPTPYKNQYDNVFACSSAQVAEFVEWLQAQPFADNTTIVLVGDHLGMQQAYYDAIIESPNYQRTTYNAFLNSATKPKEMKPRQFASFDMYPTTLAALGVKISGDKLGLGVNLFADNTPTLLEQYGSVEALNDELSKSNRFYERAIVTGMESD